MTDKQHEIINSNVKNVNIIINEFGFECVATLVNRRYSQLIKKEQPPFIEYSILKNNRSIYEFTCKPEYVLTAMNMGYFKTRCVNHLRTLR